MSSIINNEKANLIYEWHKLKIKIQLDEAKSEMYFNEKEIWWASLGSNIGHEEDGKSNKFQRPVLILKKFNKHLVLSIPLSSKVKDDKFYYYKSLFNENVKSVLICQIRLISSKRLIRKMGRVSPADFLEIKKRIRNFL